MSWKAIAGSILFVLILLAGSNFLNWKLTSISYYKDGQNSVIKDSTETRIDTVFVEVEVTKYEWIIINEGVTDIVNDVVTYSTSLDSTFVIDEDTVAVLTQDISFTEGIFEILTKLEIRPVEKIINVTKTIFQTVPVEVPADPPFYNTFWFGSVFSTIAIILLALFL